MPCDYDLSQAGQGFLASLTNFGPASHSQCRPINYCRPNFFAFPCQALPVLTPASRGLSRPCRPFMFFAFPSQVWPWPTVARQGRAGPVAAASPFFFIPWPTWPKPGHKLGSPQLSGRALSPVYPSLAGFLMQGLVTRCTPNLST